MFDLKHLAYQVALGDNDFSARILSDVKIVSSERLSSVWGLAQFWVHVIVHWADKVKALLDDVFSCRKQGIFLHAQPKSSSTFFGLLA